MRRNALILSALLIVSAAGRAAGDELRVEDLAYDLRNGDVERRWQAARLLGTFGVGAKPAAVYLTFALRDGNRTVRYYAARALAAIGPSAGDIAGANLLHAAENDPNRYVREEAAAALRLVEPTPLFLKVPWLYAKSDGVPQDWMKAFQVDRYKTIIELTNQLRHRNVANRRAAAIRLGQLRWRAAPAATVLAGALHDDDELVRYYAVQALELIGRGATRVAKETLQHVSRNDQSVKVRDQAKQTLETLFALLPAEDVARRSVLRGSSGRDRSRVVTRSMLRKEYLPKGDVLQTQLVSIDVTERRLAAWQLARLRRTDSLTIEYLCSALADRDETVRYFAVTALGRAGTSAGPYAKASLDWVRRSSHTPLVLHRAMLAMHLIDPEFAKKSDEILEGEKGEPRVAKVSTRGLWLLKPAGPRWEQRTRELKRLETHGIRAADALPELAKRLAHPNSFARAFTAETIGMIGFGSKSAVVYPLVELAESDRDLKVRQAADEALLLNLGETVVAQLREPKPPDTPTPRKVVRRGKPLSDRNIRALVGLLREEPEHRAMALRVLRSRLGREQLAPIIVALVMDSTGEQRRLGMSTLWNDSAKGDVAAPLAYALHRGLGTAHKVDLIDRIDSKHAFAPYLIPYVMRSANERVRQAALRAWSRLIRTGDWRRVLSRPWKFWHTETQGEALVALNSLDAKDVVVRSFFAGGLTLRDEAAFVKFVAALGAAMRNKGRTVEWLAQLFQAERSTVARSTIVAGLSKAKPMPAGIETELLVAMMKAEPERSIRDDIVHVLRGYGPAAEEVLPALLAQLQRETSVASQMTIVETIKQIGAGKAELQVIVVHLEESLRIQRAREMLQEVIAEQAKLKDTTRVRQKRNLLRLLAN